MADPQLAILTAQVERAVEALHDQRVHIDALTACLYLTDHLTLACRVKDSNLAALAALGIVENYDGPMPGDEFKADPLAAEGGQGAVG